jgi:outer membrane protein insertion porin family
MPGTTPVGGGWTMAIAWAGRSAVLACVLVLGMSAAWAQDATQGAIVRQIDIKGARRVEEGTVRLRLSTRVGEPYSAEKVREDVKALYAFGFFDDVVVEAEIFEGGLRLTYVLTEKPGVRAVQFVGNTHIKTEKLREKIDIAEGSVVAPGALAQNAEKIRLFYEDEGYYLARVEPRLDRISDREVNVIFQIDEGDRFEVTEIQVVGNKGLTAKQIKDVLDTRELLLFFFFGTLKRENLRRDMDRVRALYLDHGYLDIRVDEPQVEVDRKARKLKIVIRVAEGPQYKVGTVRVAGNKVFSDEEILKAISTKPGAIFSRAGVQRDVLLITESYSTLGYLFADVVPVTDVKREPLLVDVTLDMTEGKQAFVDRIEITGNTKTRDKVIRREIPLVEGNVFNSQFLALGKRNLENLNFFEEVKTETKRGSADDKVNVAVEVKEKATGQFTAGVGYSSIDGPLASVGLSQANFLGLGQSISLSGQVSTKTLRGNLVFIEPHLFDTDFSMTVTAFNERLNYKDFTGFNQDRLGGSVGFGRRLLGNMAASLLYRLQLDKIQDVASNAPPQIQLAAATNDGESSTSSLTAALVWDARDNPREPTRGYRLTGSATLAGGVLGFTNNFYKMSFDSEYYYPLFWRVVGRLHGNIAYGNGYNDTPLLVPQERYYLGGVNTVRGFRNFAISPVDPQTGGETGGNKAMYTNMEVIFPILDQFNVKGILFFDAGNVFDERSGFHFSFRRAAGGGIRLNTPLGVVGGFMGINLGQKQGEPLKVFNFTVGSTF